MADSIEKKIFIALKAKLEELTFLKLVTFERIRLVLSDFEPHEIPGVQIYDATEVYTHQRTQIDGRWSFVVEYFQAANPDGSHDQGLLMDRKFEIEQKLGSDVNLGIVRDPASGQLIHLRYVESVTNLFLVNGMSVAQLTFEALLNKPYTAIC